MLSTDAHTLASRDCGFLKSPRCKPLYPNYSSTSRRVSGSPPVQQLIVGQDFRLPTLFGTSEVFVSAVPAGIDRDDLVRYRGWWSLQAWSSNLQEN